MAVLQMQRISICALKHDRKAILEKLQSMGMIEMHQVAQDEAGFEKMDTQSAKSSFEKRVQITENALDVLNQYTPEKKSMFASLEGNELIDKKTMEAAAAKQEAVMEVAGLLIADHKKIAEAQAEIVKRNTQIEALTPWMSLEVAMNYPGTKKTAMLLGTMAAETTLEMIYGKLAEDHPEIEAVVKRVLYEGPGSRCGEYTPHCRILKTGCIDRADSGKAERRTGRTDQKDRTDNCRYPGRDHILRRRPGGTEDHR